MGTPIEVLDPVADGFRASASVGVNTAPLRVGTDWEPGDLRICIIIWTYSTGDTAQWTVGSTPAGWTRIANLAPDAQSLSRTCVYTRTLAAGDTDKVVTFGGTSQYRLYRAVSFSVRNWQQGGTVNNVIQYIANTTQNLVAPSVATGLGALVNVYFWGSLYEPPTYSIASGQSEFATITVPSTTVSDSAGNGYVTLSYESRTSGNSGTRILSIDTELAAYYVQSLFIPQAPDVIGAIGKATCVASAKSASIALQNLTTGVIGKAVATTTARQLYTPLSGVRTSPVFALPDSPISASQVTWSEEHYSAGSSVIVETTLDGGLTWSRCTNGEPIPGLPAGTSVIRQVQYRITVTRALVSDPTPLVHRVELKVASDASYDELVPLGVFLLNDTIVTETADTTAGGVTVELSGVDLSRLVSRNSWDDVYLIKGGIDYADAIQLVIDNRLPGLTYEFPKTGHLTPRLLFGHQQGGDPWQDAQDLATAIGYELYFNPFGVCCLRQIPDPKIDNPVWEFNDSSHPTINEATRAITDASTFNRVVVYGENAGGAPPVYAEAVDDDPNSPTYYLGPYGTVTTVFTSNMITSEAQAQEAAEALLRLVKGATENVDISVIPNPTLEPGDVVTIEVAGVKLTGRFLVNVIETPLAADQLQTITAYRQ